MRARLGRHLYIVGTVYAQMVGMKGTKGTTVRAIGKVFIPSRCRMQEKKHSLI
jgi:hypothetical protein